MKNAKAAILFLLMVPALLYGQNIINTLASGGTFTIKDGSTTFLSLSQSDGYLNLVKSLTLPVTTGSTVGVIFKGGSSFLHDFRTGNTFVGSNSGNFTLTTLATCNTGVGNSSLASLDDGPQNSAFGYHSLSTNTYGAGNSAFGYSTLAGNSTGSDNCAFGASSLQATTASCNSGFGSQSLYSNTTGRQNSGFGYLALRNSNADSNNAFGSRSLSANSGGANNCAFGSQALAASSSGYENTAMGNLSLYSNEIGKGNVAVGFRALYWGGYIGYTNDYNTAIGHNAGSNLYKGKENVCIGHNAQPSGTQVDSEFVLGSSAIKVLRCNVQTITSLSDARDKRNIQDLSLGLDFLMSIKPRLFHWDKREWYQDGKSDGSKMQQTPTAGFIAQELDESQNKADAGWLTLVYQSNPERLEATPGNLLPVMVKAIQELKNENDALKNELVALRASVAEQVEKEVKAALLKAVQQEDETTKVSLNDTKN